MVARGLISRKVHVLDCNCSTQSKQGEVDRYDFCVCKVRIQKGRHGEIVSATPDLKYNISMLAVGAHPKRAFRE